MLEIIIPGIVMFITMFVAFYFIGIIKDKEGNKSVKLSLVCALIAAVVGAVSMWIVTSLLG